MIQRTRDHVIKKNIAKISDDLLHRTTTTSNQEEGGRVTSAGGGVLARGTQEGARHTLAEEMIRQI